MIDVSELMHDSDFTDQYKVYRSKGSWNKGRFELTEEKVFTVTAPVQPATPRELEQFPEGDRQKGIMKFFIAPRLHGRAVPNTDRFGIWNDQPPETLYITADNVQESEETIYSDVIEYKGRLYKLIQIAPWDSFGFVRAYGYMTGTVKNG